MYIQAIYNEYQVTSGAMRSLTRNGSVNIRKRTVTSKLGIFCFLDINLQEVCSILGRNRHHGGVSHNTLKSVGKAPEYSGHRLIGHDRMSNPVPIMPNEIWTLQHLGVAVNNGGNDVLPVQSQEPLMQLVLRATRQNIEVRQFHPSVGRKQFVAQAMFRVLDLPGICHAYYKHVLGIYLTYTMYITFKFSAYAVYIFLIYMVYTVYMSCIY